MKKVFVSVLSLLVVTAAIFSFVRPDKATTQKNPARQSVEAAKWNVDRSHSNVKFAVTHLVVSEVEGAFKLFEGSMVNQKDDLTDAVINFSVDVNSINTDNDRRDNHLKSDDFFNAEKYPAMKFESTSMKPDGENKYKLSGNLTIRDVTKPVVFDVTYGGSIAAMGTTKIGFKAKTTINRFDYQLKWDKATESGSLVVGKDVDIIVNVEMNKEKV